MLNKFIESISATFVLTAAAYAAGVVQNKELFRELGVEPEMVSIDFQKALYDGGLLVFAQVAVVVKLLLPYVLGIVILCFATLLIKKVRGWIFAHGKMVGGVVSGMAYCVCFLGIYLVTVGSFSDGRNMGQKVADHLKTECTLSDVKYEGGTVVKLCAIGRTTDLLWFYDKDTKRAIAVGKDKVLTVKVGS